MRLAYSGLHVLADDDKRWKLDPLALARAACAGGEGDASDRSAAPLSGEERS